MASLFLSFLPKDFLGLSNRLSKVDRFLLDQIEDLTMERVENSCFDLLVTEVGSPSRCTLKLACKVHISLCANGIKASLKPRGGLALNRFKQSSFDPLNLTNHFHFC